MKIRFLKREFKDKLKIQWFKQNVKVLMAGLIMVSCLSIAYAAVVQTTKIQAEGIVMADADFRIIGIEPQNPNCGENLFNPRFTAGDLIINAKLPGLECTVKYAITVANDHEKAMIIKEVTALSSNDDMVYEVTPDPALFPAGENSTFFIEFKYKQEIISTGIMPENDTIGVVVSFEFAEYEAEQGSVDCSPKSWTNGDVVCTLTLDGGYIQSITSVTGSVCSITGTHTCTISGNGTFFVNYRDSSNASGTTALVTVGNIDKIPPTFTSLAITQGYTTLTVGVTGTQDTGGSGVAGCRYSVDNGITWTPNNVSCTTYQITGLEMETGYAVQFRVYDAAGNYAQSPGGTLVNTLLLTGLPLRIDPNAQGYFFDLGTLSNKLAGSTPLTSLWNGETFTFVLMKPTAVVNGNEVFSFTSTPITNIGDLQWTNGNVSGFTVASAGIDPPGAKTTATITPTAVNPNQTMTFTFNLNGKIDINDIDFVQATITYSITGVTPDPYFKVLFYFIPANGYGFMYDANGGSGRMPGSTCAAYNAACAWDATRQTGIRANGFTPPAGQTFARWNTKADGTGTNFNANASVPASTFTSKSVTTLYAIWQ